MIKGSTDFGVVMGQLASWTLILLLSEFAKVITTPLLMVVVGIGQTIAIVGALTLDPKSYSLLTSPLDTNVFTQKGLYIYFRHPIYLGVLTISLAFLVSRLTYTGRSRLSPAFPFYKHQGLSRRRCSRGETSRIFSV